MFDHISIGVRDIAATRRFYDAALKPLGLSLLSDGETSLGYGRDAVGLWISVVDRPVAADPQSGLHFCFAAPDRQSVADFHAAALAAGGKENGKPGLRADYGPDYFAAYALDPDGYRLEAYCSAKQG
jgi:catechol 2,3-dioxygenase-like lactoylglutathione lyase family enzyme